MTFAVPLATLSSRTFVVVKVSKVSIVAAGGVMVDNLDHVRSYSCVRVDVGRRAYFFRWYYPDQVLTV